jgi:hypothetical protein
MRVDEIGNGVVGPAFGDELHPRPRRFSLRTIV